MRACAKGPGRPAACCSPTRWRSARGASAPCSCAACRTASSRARPVPDPFLDDGERRALARGIGARASEARGRARARPLPVLRLRVAARGGAVPVLAVVRRGGRPAGGLAVRRRRARALHRRAVGAAGAPAARRGDLAAGRGADAARAAARPRRRRAGARAARRSARPARRRCSARWPRASASPRADSRRSRAAACAGWSSGCCSPTGPTPIRSRCAAARSPTG